jgi:hypothetical protein
MKRKIAGIILLSVCATAANLALTGVARLFETVLFLDTIFTISATFSGGLAAGVLTAVLSTAAYFPGYDFWGYGLFGLCSVATALLAWFFVKTAPADYARLRILDRPEDTPPGNTPIFPSFFDSLIMLFLLSLGLCVLISVMGGLIAVAIETVLQFPMEDPRLEIFFKLGLLRGGTNLAVAEILSRLPVNLVDRPISVFVAYGASLLLSVGLDRKRRRRQASSPRPPTPR